MLTRIVARGGRGDVRATTDGTEVEGLYREFHPDIVLLDLHMGAIDAPEVIRRVLGLVPTGEHVPVLVISGDVTDAARLSALTEVPPTSSASRTFPAK